MSPSQFWSSAIAFATSRSLSLVHTVRKMPRNRENRHLVRRDTRAGHAAVQPLRAAVRRQRATGFRLSSAANVAPFLMLKAALEMRHALLGRLPFCGRPIVAVLGCDALRHPPPTGSELAAAAVPRTLPPGRQPRNSARSGRRGGSPDCGLECFRPFSRSVFHTLVGPLHRPAQGAARFLQPRQEAARRDQPSHLQAAARLRSGSRGQAPPHGRRRGLPNLDDQLHPVITRHSLTRSRSSIRFIPNAASSSS